jgi:hypothetical protein
MKNKNCENSQCKKLFETKNPKKRFCCLHCKNQAAYNHTQNNYSWEMNLLNARKRNIKILEYLIRKNTTTVSNEELKRMGFNSEASFLPTTNKLNQNEFRYGNCLIVLVKQNEFQLKII